MKAAAQHPFSMQLTHSVRLLWQWWCGEITAMLPAALIRWLAGQRRRLAITVNDERVTISQDQGGQRRRLGTFDFAAAERAEIRKIAAVPAGATILEIAPDAALRRIVALPSASESNLAEVVSFELERHTPFRRGEIYHSFRVIGRDMVRHRITIELSVVLRATVDEMLSRLRTLGIEVDQVIAAGAEAGAAASANLLPRRPLSSVERLPHVAVSALFTTAVVLALTALAIPMVRAHREAAALEAAMQTAKQQAAESARLQSQIDAAIAESGFLAEQKRELVPVSTLLDTLTRLLPDDTWLTELKIAGNELELVGSGNSASSIIVRMDRAPGLSDAAFRSPVMQTELHREQFDIGAHLGAGTRP
jgi:general secretion pathway protein L